MNRTFKLSSIVCALALASTATFAQTLLSNTVYDTAKEQIKTSYKAERDACDSMTGNAKDICVETAKGREKVAMAHLQVQRTGTAKDQAKLVEARYEARYEVAKEVCDDQTGNAKDVCVKEAKAVHVKALADAKLAKEVGTARKDAGESSNRAKITRRMPIRPSSSSRGEGRGMFLTLLKAPGRGKEWKIAGVRVSYLC